MYSDYHGDIYTLVDLLRSLAEKYPDQIAYRYLLDDKGSEICYTYKQLDQHAQIIASELTQRNMMGKRVLMLYPSSMDFITSFYGCLYAGVTAVPVYPPKRNQKIGRLRAIIDDCEPDWVMTTTRVIELAEPLFKETPGLENLPWLTTDDLDYEQTATWNCPDINEHTLAFLQYTSGSTGNPKGVMLSHNNLLKNTEANYSSKPIPPGVNGVSWLPLFHDMGLIGGVIWPLYGCFTAILMSPTAFLQKPIRWLKAISDFKAVVSAAPNFAFEYCVENIPDKDFAGLDLSRWEVAILGAEPIRGDTLIKFVNKFRSIGFRPETFYPSYGLAESTVLVTGGLINVAPKMLNLDAVSLEYNQVVIQRDVFDFTEGPRQTFVSCGVPWMDHKVVIVNPHTCLQCKPDEIGEIWVSGPSVAQGYWGRDEVNKEIFQARLADTGEGPYLRTGDLGFLLNNELYITGRQKDVIIIRGLNHYPQDIEFTIGYCHEALKPESTGAFTISVDDEEQLVIVQELKRTFVRKFDVADVISTIRQVVVEQYSLQVYAIVLLKPSRIPKTSSGKIQRHKCKELYLDDKLAGVFEWDSTKDSAIPIGKIQKSENTLESLPQSSAETPLSTPINNHRDQSTITKWLANKVSELAKIPTDQIDRDISFAAFGLDSVKGMRLSGDLEQWLDFDQPLNVSLIYDYPSINKLAEHLANLTSTSASVDKKLSSTTALGEPIAIIGMQCRFPQAKNIEEFWSLLCDAKDAVAKAPDKRFEKMKMLFEGGFINDIDQFDAAFFGISPREAQMMDPQQRLLMEVSYSAMQNAGIAHSALAGSSTGVYVGISHSDYGQLLAQNNILSAYSASGNALSIAANRLSYFYDFNGPSLAVDTACSSSLSALEIACNHLRLNQCQQAIVGGVNLLISDKLTSSLSQANMLAPDYRCKAFSADADGYVRSEGCGVVVLKPLSQAERDGDPILATILGAAVHQDGRSNGLTAPNGLAQAQAIKEALANAHVDPAEVSFIETHGTGTQLGDPIEINAINSVYGVVRKADKPLILGAVKANIGHLEAAAGMAGLIKTVLCLQYQQIPKQIHADQLNTNVAWDQMSLKVPTEQMSWVNESKPRIAGVSGFGFGGTNVHVILSQAQNQCVDTEKTVNKVARPLHCLSLSAKNNAVLQHLKSQTIEALENNKTDSLADFCFSVNAHRDHFSHRLAVFASTRQAMIEKLQSQSKRSKASLQTPQLSFLFSGQGAQYAGMAEALYQTQPVFTQMIDRCAELLSSSMDHSLLSLLWGDDASLLQQTQYTQPAIFSLEVALAETWMSWGIQPEAVMGHSVGEYAAAYIAGVFSLEDAIKLISGRAQLMYQHCVAGAMLAVTATQQQVQPHLNGFNGTVAIAAVNSPTSLVLSGADDNILNLQILLESLSIKCKKLRVSHAFHSPMMQPMLQKFAEVANQVTYHLPKLPLISNRYACTVTQEVCHADYWVGHVENSVLFSDSIAFLNGIGINSYLEVGPGRSLLAMVTQCLPNEDVLLLTSIRHKNPDWQQMLSTLSILYENGCQIDWHGFDSGYYRQFINTPSYPFQRQRYWADIDVNQPHSEDDLVENDDSNDEAEINSIVDDLKHCASHQKEVLLQKYLCEQIAEVLSSGQNLTVDIHDDLFALGMDSLMAVEIKNRLEKNLHCQLSPTLLFNHSHIYGLGEFLLTEILMDDHSVETDGFYQKPMLARDKDQTDLPLSFGQERMWFLQQLDVSDHRIYHIPGLISMTGHLDELLLRSCLLAMVSRHESLRTNFIDDNGTPRLYTHEMIECSMDVIDLTELTMIDGVAELKRLCQQQSDLPFDLTKDPLIRVTLFKLPEQHHQLFINLHHIIADGWSVSLLLEEITTLYRSWQQEELSPLKDLTIQYADFVLWQKQMLQGEFLEQQLSYWAQKCDQVMPLELHTDFPRPAMQTYNGAWMPLSLDADTSKKLQQFSHSHQVTLFMTLLTVFKVLLHRYSGQNDICVGTPVASRTRSEIEALVGLFINPVALRSDLSNDPHFIELLDQVKQTTLGAFSHQHVPFEKVVERVQPDRDLSRSPLFQVMFVLHTEMKTEFSLPGLKIELETIDRQLSEFDLTLNLTLKNRQLQGEFEYNTDLFSDKTMSRFKVHFQQLVRSILQQPQSRLSKLELLSKQEKQTLLVDWNQSKADFNQEQLVPHRLTLQASRTPNKSAVVFNEDSLSYAELESQSNQLAHYLMGQGVKPDVCVAIALERSIQCIVSMMAIFKAGGAYVPLDINAPLDRLSFMLEETQAVLIITSKQWMDSINTEDNDVFAQTSKLYLDADVADIEKQSTDVPKNQLFAHHLAYVIYTSGSSGKPKGVMITHGNLLDYCYGAINQYALTHQDRVLQFATISFDASIEEIFPTLMVGACLVLRNENMLADANTFFDLARSLQLTVLSLPTAYWHSLCQQLNDEVNQGQLRLVIIGGEKALPEPLRNWQNKFSSDIKLLNTYGPTESTVVTSVFDLTEFQADELPIGQAFPNRLLYVVNPDHPSQLMPIGVPGELCVAGNGLARGYLQRQSLEQQKFIINPFSNDPTRRMYRTGDKVCYLSDGNLVFLGRIDDQVKIRGFRVELGEIETVINQLPQIDECVVVAKPDASQTLQIIAYVVTHHVLNDDAESLSITELRNSLKENLPDYMLPVQLLEIPHLPLTSHGKVDKRALPKVNLSDSQEEYQAPRNSIEERLVEIWQTVLQVEKVGVHDDFFALGGHSLLATQIISQVRQSFKTELALKTLFVSPTIASIAEVINQSGELSELEAIEIIDRNTELPLSFAQERLWFLDQFEEEGHVYHIPGSLTIDGELDESILQKTLQTIVERHESLRSIFVAENGKPILQILPASDWTIDIVECSDLTEVEQLIEKALHKPFDLTKDFPFRALWIKLTPEKHRFFVNMHHIISDGWSVGRLIDELFVLYDAYRQDLPNPLA
ncbi:MAG: amino acid adenylation domain-containing protein, partial [Methylococcales bacterium]|nr:amino acid adenylation domain-containing protein [Methylococcales bacterium]